MIRWIVASSLNFRLLVATVAALMMAFGIIHLRDMPMDAYPAFGPVKVEIQVESPGLSIDEVEGLVTVPLESGFLSMVSWLDEINSETIPGMTSIVLSFLPGTSLLHARQVVQERLTEAHTLPDASKPPAVLQPLSSISRLMKIGLTSDTLSLVDMSVLAYWTIKPRLMRVPGVAHVAVWGQRPRQIQVQVDPERLRAQGVTLTQVRQTAGDATFVSVLPFMRASTTGTGGFVNTPNQRLGVRHHMPISSANDLAEVIIEGTTLRLEDVANVVEGHPPLIGDAIIDDGPGLLLVVEKFPWANTLQVTRGVEGALDALRPGLTGIAIDTQIFRPATFIEMAVDNLSTAMLIGGVLMLLMLFALLHDWRSGLISFVSISMSVMVAALVLYQRGITIDLMVFAGLMVALGIIIDDAVIDTENIMRRLRQHRRTGGDRSTARVIFEASLEMRGAIGFATLILVLAVVPAFALAGVSGAFLTPLALSYVLAVLASLAVALTVTPALSLMLLRKAALQRGEAPFIEWLRRGYDVALTRIVHRPRPVYLAVAATVLVGVALLPWLRQESLLPRFKERDLMIQWDGVPGTSHLAMSRIAKQVGRELRSVPGVRNVAAHVGRAETGDQVVGAYSSMHWVRLDAAADYDATVAAVQEVVDGYPGFSRAVLTYPEERIKSAQARAADKGMVVRLYGHDLRILRSEAQEVARVLAEIEGVVDVHVERQVEEPTLEIEVDLAAAQRYGVKPGEIRRAAATLVSGIAVGSLFEHQKMFDVLVWGTPETRHSLTAIRELLIDTADGGHARLQDVAKVRIVAAPTSIKREGASRRLDVDFTVSGRERGSVALDVERRLKQVEFPLEYHAELLETHGDARAGRNRVLSIAIACAIGILLLLQAAFQSWQLAFRVFVTLPMALVGGVLVILAAGSVLSLGALVGFLALFGIAARNCILLFRHYRHLEQQEGEAFGPGIVLRGTSERFGPILISAITIAPALLPLVLFGDIPGLEIVHPMAVVVLGGFVTSTVFTLFGIPALYLVCGAGAEPDIDL